MVSHLVTNWQKILAVTGQILWALVFYYICSIIQLNNAEYQYGLNKNVAGKNRALSICKESMYAHSFTATTKKIPFLLRMSGRWHQHYKGSLHVFAVYRIWKLD